MTNKTITQLTSLTAASGDEIPINRGGVDGKITLPLPAAAGGTGQTSFRQRLSADTTFYVRTAPVDATVSIANPAEVTCTGHGLQANDPVVFSVPTQRAICTISSANPGVVTCASHGFTIGDPIQFRTTGTLPTNLPARYTAGTWIGQDQESRATYYVLSAGFTSGSFRVSATPGGSAIDTSAGVQAGTHTVERARQIFVGSGAITAGSPGTITIAGHGLTAGTPIVVATDVSDSVGGSSLLLWKPWQAVYYVSSSNLTPNTFEVSATSGGSSLSLISLSGGIYYVYRYQPIPTGITEGATYYVLSTGLTSSTFRFSASQGGSAVSTSGSVAALGSMQISTGNNSNDGSAATRAGALLSLQQAYDNLVTSYDFNNFNVTIELAGGTYLDTGQLVTLGRSWVGGGTLTISGVSAGNPRLEMTGGNGDLFLLTGNLPSIAFNNFETFNKDFATCNSRVPADSLVYFDNITVGAWAMEDPHFLVQGGTCTFGSNIYVLHGCGRWDKQSIALVFINERARVYNAFPTIYLFDNPLFPFTDDQNNGTQIVNILYRIIDGGYLWNNATTFVAQNYTGSQGLVDGPASTLYHWSTSGSGDIAGTKPVIRNSGGYYYQDLTTPDNSYSLRGYLNPNVVESTTQRTLSVLDLARRIEFTNTSSSFYIIPSSTSVAVPIGAHIDVIRKATGPVTFSTGAGVTIGTRTGLIISPQWGKATIYKSSANGWVAYGDLSS